MHCSILAQFPEKVCSEKGLSEGKGKVLRTLDTGFSEPWTQGSQNPGHRVLRTLDAGFSEPQKVNKMQQNGHTAKFSEVWTKVLRTLRPKFSELRLRVLKGFRIDLPPHQRDPCPGARELQNDGPGKESGDPEAQKSRKVEPQSLKNQAGPSGRSCWAHGSVIVAHHF